MTFKNSAGQRWLSEPPLGRIGLDRSENPGGSLWVTHENREHATVAKEEEEQMNIFLCRNQ